MFVCVCVYVNLIIKTEYLTLCSTSKLEIFVDSPLSGGDVVVYVPDIDQPSLPTPFYSVLLSISVIMALEAVFHSIHSRDHSPLSHSVLLVLFLPYWKFCVLCLCVCFVTFVSGLIL